MLGFKFSLRSLYFILFFSLFMTVSGGGASPTTFRPIAVRDDLGRRIPLKNPAQRIISLSPATTEILFAIGAGRKVIGVCSACDYPPGVRRLAQVGDFMKPSLERIASLRPDLIVFSSATVTRSVPDEMQARIGVPFFVLRPRTVAQVLRGIGKLGIVTGHIQEASGLADRLERRLAAVRNRVGRKKPVFTVIEIAPPPSLIVAGPGTYIDDALTVAGGTNVFADAGQPFPLISLETLFRKNPQVYLLACGGDPEEVANREGFPSLDCVREGRVYKVNPDHLLRPGPRLVNAIETMARVLHPE